MFRKLCGDSTLKNVILVTNMWQLDSHHANEAREMELSNKFFKPALEKGAQMARHDNTAESAHGIVRKIINNHPLPLQIQRELVDEKKDISDTAAGESISQELKELTRKHQEKLREVREEMAQALKEKDEEARQELKETKRVLENMVEKIRKDSEGMITNYAKEKARMEERMKEMQREAKLERERAEAEYDRKLAVFTDRLERTPDAPAFTRARWEQEIKKLQDRITIPIYQ